MKNELKMEATELSAPVVDRRSCGVVECENLRRGPSGAGLHPVGKPERIGKIRLKDIVGCIGDVYIGHDENGKVRATTAVAEVYVIGAIEGRIASMTALDSNSALAVDSLGYHYRLRLNDRRDVEVCQIEGRGSIVMRAGSGAMVSEPLAEMTLAGTYSSRSGRLDNADTKTLTDIVRDALVHVVDSVQARGYIVGPTIGRCIARDSEGVVILSTPPLLIHGESGGSGAPVINAQVKQTGGNFNQVQASTLQFTALSLTLELGGDLPDDTAARIDHVDVMMTPSLMPVALDNAIETALTDYDGTECRLVMTMPGVPRDRPEQTARRRIIGALERLSQLERVVATVSGADLREGRVTLRPSIRESLSTQVSRVDSVLQMAVNTASTAEGERCTAAVMTRMGDLIVKGNISRVIAEGWSPVAFSASVVPVDGPMDCYAATAVNTESGVVQTAVAHAVGQRGRIAVLNPLICYPGSRGQNVELCYTDSTGAQVKINLPLTPGADGRYCYCLSDDLKPLKATETIENYTAPLSSVSNVMYQGRVMVASLDNPAATRVMEDVSGRVTAIVETAGGNSLEFGRRRAVLTSTRGIYSVAVNPAANKLKIVMIDKRGVADGCCVANAEGGMLIAAGSDLLSVNGNSLKTIERGLKVDMVETVRKTGETWMKIDERTVVRTPRGGYYTRSDVSVDRFVDNGLYTVAIDAAGMAYNIDNESATQCPGVKWTCRSGSASRSVGRLSVDVNTSAVTGTIALSADRGSGPGEACRVVSLDVDGAVNEPLVTRIVTPSRPVNYTLSIEAETAASDFIINAVSIQ